MCRLSPVQLARLRAALDQGPPPDGKYRWLGRGAALAANRWNRFARTRTPGFCFSDSSSQGMHRAVLPAPPGEPDEPFWKVFLGIFCYVAAVAGIGPAVLNASQKPAATSRAAARWRSC